MKIQVKIKHASLGGMKMIYPACAFAKTFAELTRKSTLSIGDISNIKALGYEVEVIPNDEEAALVSQIIA